MSLVKYALVIATMVVAISVLIALAQQVNQSSNTQVNTIHSTNINATNTTSTQLVSNCTQYGEFQGEFQCGPQENITKYNTTNVIPYQYEDEVEYESSIED